MKKPINEIYRMQQLAGIKPLNELEVNAPSNIRLIVKNINSSPKSIQNFLRAFPEEVIRELGNYELADYEIVKVLEKGDNYLNLSQELGNYESMGISLLFLDIPFEGYKKHFKYYNYNIYYKWVSWNELDGDDMLNDDNLDDD